MIFKHDLSKLLPCEPRLLRQGHGVMALHLASAQDQGSQVVTRGEPPTGKTKKKTGGEVACFPWKL